MKQAARLLAGASAVGMAAFATSAAQAAGTTSGSTITNNVSVSYSVGGVAQTPGTATNSFTVDRKVSLTVAELGTTTTYVVPGQTAAVDTFTITNTSNAPLDIGLSLAQQSGGATVHGSTDNFDVTGPAYYVDTNGNNVYDAGTDTALTYIDELAADASRTIFVVSNIPAGRANNDAAGITLTGQAREPGTAGTQGAVIAATVGANTAGVDTVLADTAGASDAANDGQHSARGDYTVQTATLAITKTSKVISDPVNNTTNPKLIPGAVVEYCIQVANTGAAPATNVVVSDPVPTQTTYSSSFGIFTNGTVTAGVCNADGSSTSPNGGTFASNTVTGAAMSIAANSTKTLYFRATIN